MQKAGVSTVEVVRGLLEESTAKIVSECDVSHPYLVGWLPTYLDSDHPYHDCCHPYFDGCYPYLSARASLKAPL